MFQILPYTHLPSHFPSHLQTRTGNQQLLKFGLSILVVQNLVILFSAIFSGLNGLFITEFTIFDAFGDLLDYKPGSLSTLALLFSIDSLGFLLIGISLRDPEKPYLSAWKYFMVLAIFVLIWRFLLIEVELPMIYLPYLLVNPSEVLFYGLLIGVFFLASSILLYKAISQMALLFQVESRYINYYILGNMLSVLMVITFIGTIVGAIVKFTIIPVLGIIVYLRFLLPLFGVKNLNSLSNQEFGPSLNQGCLICLKPLNVDTGHCPHCSRGFHHEHLFKWVTNSGQCPACKKPLSHKEIIVSNL